MAKPKKTKIAPKRDEGEGGGRPGGAGAGKFGGVAAPYAAPAAAPATQPAPQRQTGTPAWGGGKFGQVAQWIPPAPLTNQERLRLEYAPTTPAPRTGPPGWGGGKFGAIPQWTQPAPPAVPRPVTSPERLRLEYAPAGVNTLPNYPNPRFQGFAEAHPYGLPAGTYDAGAAAGMSAPVAQGAGGMRNLAYQGAGGARAAGANERYRYPADEDEYDYYNRGGYGSGYGRGGYGGGYPLWGGGDGGQAPANFYYGMVNWRF